MSETADLLLAQILAAVGVPPVPHQVTFDGQESLPTVFAVSDLAQAALGAAGAAVSSLMALEGGATPTVRVDRALASAWFSLSIRPRGWSLPPPWDAIAGDYLTRDGWIRLHTNAAPHRRALLDLLDVPDDRDAVATAVGQWTAEELETEVVAAGGAAAAMRSLAAWAQHPQGRAVGAEPLVHAQRTAPSTGRALRPVGRAGRPLARVRVLDLTRVLAGPVATRLLAGWGAEVLRVDPAGWDEPAVVPEVTLGKRCCRLDLRSPTGKRRFLALLGSSDVLVHGYRPGALEGLGLGVEVRAEHCPDLVDVSLDAYGWSGPWHGRRGFDSLVQMSTGIADRGRTSTGSDRPVPLPVQALDHAAGYLLAAAALSGLAKRRADGHGSRWRTSLARTAALLIGAGISPAPPPQVLDLGALAPDDRIERTVWGDAQRLPAPLEVRGAPLEWPLPARPLGSDDARWEID